jgi:hypothetical protein
MLYMSSLRKKLRTVHLRNFNRCKISLKIVFLITIVEILLLTAVNYSANSNIERDSSTKQKVKSFKDDIIVDSLLYTFISARDIQTIIGASISCSHKWVWVQQFSSSKKRSGVSFNKVQTNRKLLTERR